MKKILILFFYVISAGLFFISFAGADNSAVSDSFPWQEFKKNYGENWNVKWNKKTGTPHRVFGNKKPVTGKDGVLKRTEGQKNFSESEFESVSRAFIEQNQGLFKIDNSDLKLQRSRKHGPIFYVTFKQLFQNVPVYNSRVDFQFDKDGNLLLFGADVFPDINIPVLQKIDENNAVKIIKDDINFNPEKDKISVPELLIYPEEIKEGFKYYLVWKLEVTVKRPAGNWVYFIDAENAGIKMKYNDINNDISGKITGYILPFYSGDSPQEVSFPYESVFAGSYSAISNKDGNYSVPTPFGIYLLTSGLSGKYLNVTNEDGNNSLFYKTLNDSESQNIIWNTGLTSGYYEEMNVYYHSMKMHDYIKSIDPEFTGMDYCVPAVVRITDYYRDNAYWSNTEGMGFGAGTSGYSKSWALFADVIYHEYTHGVTDRLYMQEGGSLDYIDGTESGAMDEGFSDYWACTLTDESLIGEGLLHSRPYIRNIDNNFVSPEDFSDEVHADGRIIAGAMWRMRKYLGRDTADRLFHFARYGLPTTFADFFLEVLMKDDDNNNLRDGTPNSSNIYTAFGNSGISGLQIEAVSIDDNDGGNGNGRVNPGEKISIIVTLENKMFEDAEDIRAVLSTGDIFTDIISDQAFFGNINEGLKADGLFTVLVNKSTPIDYLISFNLKITDKKGYTFELPFDINITDVIEKKWKVETITGISNLPDYAGSRVLERDKDGNFHLLYGYSSLNYAFYDNNKWVTYLLDSSKLYSYNYSLCLAGNIPHIVHNFADYTGSYLKYKKLANGQWETEIIDSNYYSRYSYPSLILDSSYNPHISYSINSNIFYNYRDSDGNWKTEEVDTVHCGSNNSLGIGKNNLIQIGYYDFCCGGLRYAKRASGWENGFLDISVDIGKYTCLRIGTDGYPHITYYDNDKGNLKYMYWDGYSWETKIVDFDGDAGLYPSMAVDWKNRPHIAYYDKTNGALKYAYYNGEFWEITVIDDSDDAGYYPAMVIDENRLPHVAYYSKSTDGNIYLKFASSRLMASPVYLNPENNTFTGLDVTLQWEVNNINEGDTISYDVYFDTSGAGTKIAENISDSSYTLNNLEYRKTYYWRIIYRDKNKFESRGPVYRFKTTMAGDIDKNGIVDGDDLVPFANSFGSTKDFSMYKSISDIDLNGRIDGADLMFIGMNFGKSY
ncbi:MAG: M36 family metallopeptidase [bacterium]